MDLSITRRLACRRVRNRHEQLYKKSIEEVSAMTTIMK